MSHWFRKPRTKQEKAKAFDGWVRAKRSAARLPSSYDDMNVAARRDRSWKRFRNHHWKEV